MKLNFPASLTPLRYTIAIEVIAFCILALNFVLTFIFNIEPVEFLVVALLMVFFTALIPFIFNYFLFGSLLPIFNVKVLLRVRRVDTEEMPKWTLGRVVTKGTTVGFQMMNDPNATVGNFDYSFINIGNWIIIYNPNEGTYYAIRSRLENKEIDETISLESESRMAYALNKQRIEETYQKNKDLLTQLLPFIAMAIVFLATTMLFYLLSNQVVNELKPISDALNRVASKFESANITVVYQNGEIIYSGNQTTTKNTPAPPFTLPV